ncbi:MAG: nuclear transport factor 2 family protein [Gammaproteobacteria bacterium]
MDRRNAHDMDAWGKLFTDDVDYVNREGGCWKSNKENMEGRKALHDMLVRQKQTMTHKSAVGKIPFLEPGIALVHATWGGRVSPCRRGKRRTLRGSSRWSW